MNDRIMIRIRNDSQLDIENFWLGAGPRGGATQNTAFGAIPSGGTTRYKSIEPVLANYRKMNLVIGDQRILGVIDPQEHLGIAELEAGKYYTFAYQIVDAEARLTLLEDK